MGRILNKVKSHLVEEIFNEVKPCIEKNLQKNNEILDIVTEIREFQSNNVGGVLSINNDTLNQIYDLFIKPYLDCEIYDIGTIMDVIRLNKIIDEQIAIVENNKEKIVLKILRDVLTVIVNARNDKLSIIQYKSQISTLEEKYRKSNIMVINLRRRLEAVLDKKEYALLSLEGSFGMKVKNLKPFIYMQARMDIDRAWYHYLYPDCQLDPKKYQSTIAYVRSFGTLQNAYNTLINLLDKKFATYDDDIEKAADNFKDEKIEEIKEN